MALTDTLTARAVALIVIMTGLVYYHFYLLYKVKSTIFTKIKSGLESLWTNKILPQNSTYLTTNLVDTITAIDSYNTLVDPVVKNSIAMVNSDEATCVRGTEYLTIIIEIVVVLSSIALLVSALQYTSYLPPT